VTRVARPDTPIPRYRDTMHRLLMWLDDCDDLLVVFRVQAPAVIATALLATASLVVLGALVLFGAPELHAAH
jgi:hypothetical protein